MVRYEWGDYRNFNLVPGDNVMDNLLMAQVEYEF